MATDLGSHGESPVEMKGLLPLGRIMQFLILEAIMITQLWQLAWKSRTKQWGVLETNTMLFAFYVRNECQHLWDMGSRCTGSPQSQTQPVELFSLCSVCSHHMLRRHERNKSWSSRVASICNACSGVAWILIPASFSQLGNIWVTLLGPILY